MKAIKDIPKKMIYRTCTLMVVISFILLGCTKSDDDIINDMDKPVTELPGGKKDDMFIDIDNSQNNHGISCVGFFMYNNLPAIQTVIGVGDYSRVPFEAEINENGDTELSISMTYDGTTNNYVLQKYINMDKTIIVLPPEPEAVKISFQLKDANNDKIIANIDDSALDYAHVSSIEFGMGTTAPRCKTYANDKANMTGATNGKFYYDAYYMEQFDNLFNLFKEHATDVSILQVNTGTGDTIDISNRRIATDWYNTNLPYDEVTNGVSQDSLNAVIQSRSELTEPHTIYIVSGTFKVNLNSITEKVTSAELQKKGISTNTDKSYSLILP